jgi:hypothetical protein
MYDVKQLVPRNKYSKKKTYIVENHENQHKIYIAITTITEKYNNISY